MPGLPARSPVGVGGSAGDNRSIFVILSLPLSLKKKKIFKNKVKATLREVGYFSVSASFQHLLPLPRAISTGAGRPGVQNASRSSGRQNR